MQRSLKPTEAGSTPAGRTKEEKLMNIHDYEPGPWKDVHPIGGMNPFVCSYTKEGVWFGITLYGTSEDQVLEDNCAELDNLRIDGILIAEADAVPRQPD